MQELQLSKVDQVACILKKLAEAIEQLDDRFSDEQGNIHIKELKDILELASLGYSTVKDIFENCLGKSFEISSNDTLSKILKLILDLLLEIQPNAKTQTISSPPTVYSSVSVS